MSAPQSIALSRSVSAALKRRAVEEGRPVTDVAVAILCGGLGTETEPWPGFVATAPGRSAELLGQLERDLGGLDVVALSSPVATEGQIVANAQARAAEIERAVTAADARVAELERQARAAVPLSTRLAGAPALAGVLGATAPPAPEPTRALGRLSPSDYGMRSVIGSPER